MKRSNLFPVVVMTALALSLFAGCAGNTVSRPAPAADLVLSAPEVKLRTIARVEAATAVLASDQHVFRFDGESSRALTVCDGTTCGVSPTAEGIEGALLRAQNDPRLDFGSHHFAERLKDSLELKPQPQSVQRRPPRRRLRATDHRRTGLPSQVLRRLARRRSLLRQPGHPEGQGRTRPANRARHRLRRQRPRRSERNGAGVYPRDVSDLERRHGRRERQ